MGLLAMGREIFGRPDVKGGKLTLSKDQVDGALAARWLRASLTAITRSVDRLEANLAAAEAESGPLSPAASSEEIAGGLYSALSELLPGYARYDPDEAPAAARAFSRG